MPSLTALAHQTVTTVVFATRRLIHQSVGTVVTVITALLVMTCVRWVKLMLTTLSVYVTLLVGMVKDVTWSALVTASVTPPGTASVTQR